MNGNENISELTLSQEASSLVAQYKNIIREQDGKLQSMNEKVKQLQTENENLTVNHLVKVIISFLTSFSFAVETFRSLLVDESNQ